MALYAICDSVNRVAKRLTTDDPPKVAADEIAVAIDEKNNSLDGGPWKFDGAGAKSVATRAEFETALTPKPSATAQALIDAWAAVEADGTAPASVKALAATMKAHYTPKFSGVG